MPRRIHDRQLSEAQRLAEDRAEAIQALKAHRDVRHWATRAQALGSPVQDIAAHAGLTRQTIHAITKAQTEEPS